MRIPLKLIDHTITFRADGYLRVISNLDKIKLNNAIIFHSIYIEKEYNGSSGSTSIAIKKNGDTLYSTSILYSASTKTVNDLTLSVSKGDVLSMDITEVETGEPCNLFVQLNTNNA